MRQRHTWATLSLHRKVRQLLLVVSALLFVTSLPGATEIVNDQPRPALDVPYAVSTPQVTASATDTSWNAAGTVTGLSLALGITDQTLVPLPTEVKVLWDANYLYIRYLSRDTEIYCPISGRDANVYQNDAVELFLDPTGDAKQYFEFQISANNSVFDQLFISTTEPVWDKSLVLLGDCRGKELWRLREWNCEGVRTAASIQRQDNGEYCWIVDLALPAKEILRRLGQSKFQPMILRANFIRYDWIPSNKGTERTLIPMNWGPVLSGNPHTSPAAMGYLRLQPKP